MEEKERRLKQLLRDALSKTKQWEEARAKAVLQVRSLHNLAVQLETVQHCDRSGQMGVLSGLPLVVKQLQGKLVDSIERACGFISRERKVMEGAVRELHHKHKRAAALLTEIVETAGVIEDVGRTSTSFSPFDMATWVEELSLIYYVDWKEKVAALEGLTHSSRSAASVCEVWEKVPEIDCETSDGIHYTLQ